MNSTAFYFLPALILPVIIHLIGRKPEREINFPPFEILKRVMREYRWYLRIRNLLLLTVRISVLGLFILSASRLSCGALKEGEGVSAIIIDSSYSTMTWDGKRRNFEREVELAKEILTTARDARVFKCSDHLEPLFIDDLIRGKIQPDFIAGNAKRCDEELSRMNLREVIWITDGRKEGFEELKGRKGMRVMDVSGGKKYYNVWIDDVRIEEGMLEVSLRSNSKVRIRWEIRSEVSTLRGEHEINGSEILRVVFPDSGPGMVKIEGDSLDADNYRFLWNEGMQENTVGILNFSPSEIPYMDEAFYIKKALQKGKERWRIIERTPAGMKDVPEDFSFTFILNPDWNPYLRKFIGVLLEKDLPFFISAGDRGGMEGLSEFLGLKLRGIKEIGAVRELVPEVRFPFINKYEPEEISDRIYIEKLYLFEREGIEPIVSLSSGEPLFFKIKNKNAFILVTTSDLQWSQFPIARLFTPFLLDLVQFYSGGAQPVEGISGGMEAEKGVKSIFRADMEFASVPGIYKKGGKTFIANLHPSRESMLTPLPPGELKNEETPVFSGKGIALWKYLLFLTGFFMLFEAILLR